MRMLPDTVATLNQILSKQLFRNVGNYDSFHCTKVKSWDDALAHCDTLEWRNLRLSARNDISGALFPKYQDVLNRWNDKVDEIHEFFGTRIVDQVATLQLAPERQSVVLRFTRSDLLSLAMEIEHRPYVTATFFIGISYWYDRGHFPCGWDGEYPQGKLFIY